jgi:hypothetical protein
MYRKIVLCFLTVALTAMFAASALGQVTAGAVAGSVVDTAGAVIPNATVTLRNKATGQTLTTQSTGTGSYSFPNVPVGEYALTAETSGFAPATQDPVRVALNQETSVRLTLGAAGVTGVVEVTAASEALVQTTSSQLGNSYEQRLVQNLPIFGNQNALALLSPNVVERSSGVLGAGGSVGGTRARGNVFTIDGVDNNDPSVTGPAVGVIQDAVAEFTLLTNNFNAEFGGGGGGQFVTITRSGTNEFHGNAFVYLQSQHLNAATSAEETQLRSGQIGELPRRRNTRYGGTFGGPIARDRLFFFSAFERTVNAEAGAGRTFLSPTAAGLGALASVPGARPFIFNLLQNNLTLATSQSATETVLGVPVAVGPVSVNIPTGFTDNSFQINIDHNRGATDQFRYRFNYSDFSSVGAGLGSPNFNFLNVYETRNFSATWVRTFSPRVVNDLRLSWRRAINDVPLQNPANLSFPNITVRTLDLQLGPPGNLPQSGGDNVYQVADTLTYIHGAHTFKFGGEFRRILTTSSFLARQRGDYIYNDLSELIRDIMPTGRNALRGVGNGTFTGNTSRWYFFGQDDWKVTPNLTLNLGLRYEFASVPRASEDFLPFFRGVSVTGLDFENLEPDRNNFGPRVGFAYAPDVEGGLLGWLFGRRGQSAIRAHVSMSYNDVFQNLLLFSKPPQLEQELDAAQVIARVPGFNTGPGFLERGGLPSTQLPFTGGPSAVRATIGGITNTETLRMPETYSFTLSFQRELTPTMGMEIRYLGTRGRHLPVQVPQNLPVVPLADRRIPTFFGGQPTAAQVAGLPTFNTLVNDSFNRGGAQNQPFDQQGFFGGVTGFPPIGNSQYDSGSISVTRRFSRGFAFTTAYTFSKTLDDSTNELFSSVVNPRRPQDFDNIRNEWGLSSLDIPHRFVFAANYEIPWFRSSSNGFVRGFLGGWEIAPIFQAQSGQPWTPLSGIDTNQNFDAAADRTIFNPAGAPGTGSRVCAVNSAGQLLSSAGGTTIGGQPVTLATCAVSSYSMLNAVAYFPINPNAQYIQAGPLALATAGRNTLRSKGFHRTDLTVIKNFRFGEERYNLQFGAEIFNLWNQRNRTIATVSPTNTAFVNVNSTSFNNYGLGVVGGRTIQLRAKFIF